MKFLVMMGFAVAWIILAICAKTPEDRRTPLTIANIWTVGALVVGAVEN